MFFRFVRQFSLILCAAFFASWCGAEPHAQSVETKNRQNRNDREVRTVQPTNPANVMMRDMQESLKKLPWDHLSPAAQAKIKHVVSNAPLFRRLPQQTVYADPEIYHFLLRHPDMVVGFWDHLGATQLSLREVKENQFILKEITGTVAAIEVLYRTNDLCIVYARGEYRGPLIAKPYQGAVLLVLRTQFTRDSINEPMIVCDLDAFVQINSLGADVLAKLFFTSLAKVADSNFEITVSFVGQVSKTAFRNADALKGSAEDISSIRQEVCDEFCEVVDRAAMRFTRRNQPTSLTSKQQYKQHVELPGTNHDFLLSLSKPPADWGMDHFFDSPQALYEDINDKGAGELNVPKSIELDFSENTVPRLPKPN